MHHPFMFVLKLSTLKKLPDKKTVLRGAAADGCTQLFEGFQMAFDKKRVYNIKSAPLIEIDDTYSQEELMKPGTYTWDMFKALVGLLEKDDLDDETKKTLMYEACEESGILEWNVFYRPILMKNLKCGVTAKTINAILDEFGSDAMKYKTPIWKIQHASMNGLHAGINYLEPDLDGTRAITVINRELKTVKMYNDKGTLIKNPKIDLEPLIDLSYQFPGSVVLDGEIINRSYGSLMNKDEKTAHYAVYDIIPLDDFNQSYCPLPLVERKQALDGLSAPLREETNGQVYVLPSLRFDFADEKSEKKLNGFKEEASDAGFTSIIVKGESSHYTCEEDMSWFKITNK